MALILSIKRWVVDHLPDSVRGSVEYYRHPELLDSLGGPFNGQCFRQLVYLDLAQTCDFKAIVETGAYRGSTTVFLAQNSGGAPVYSCECSSRYFQFTKRRLRTIPNVFFLKSDSREFIRRLKIPRQEPIFFYLDAHWGEDLPLREELDLIMGNFDHFVVMIDDFEIPNDLEYGFDDYGPGKKLSLCDFPLHQDNRVTCYVPARRSSQESGLRRGAIVLASQSLKSEIEAVGTLIALHKII
jgi:hypothetical protein